MSEVNTADTAEATALPEAQAESAADAPAQSVAEGAQATADAVDPVKQAQSEDPEFELEGGIRLRKSELGKLYNKRKELDRAAFAKFEAASKIEKQMASLRESDPEEYFRLRGVDPLQYAVEKLQREVEMREASPEKRALLEAQAKVAALEAERSDYQQQQEEAATETEKQRFIAKLDKELPTAVQKAGLPTDPLVFRQVAGVLADQIRSGIPEDPELAAEIVAEGYRDTFKSFAATLKYEDAVKQFPEFVKLVREGDLARARGVAAAPARPAATSNAPKKPPESKTSGSQKFNDYFDDWNGLVQRPS